MEGRPLIFYHSAGGWAELKALPDKTAAVEWSVEIVRERFGRSGHGSVSQYPLVKGEMSSDLCVCVRWIEMT